MLNINASEPLTILKVHGRNGNLKMNKSDIFTVLLTDSNVIQKIKCDRKCIVTFKCSEGDVKQKDDLLCVLSPCPHDIVISGFCGLCSMPVEIKNFGNGEIKCDTDSRFAMLHSNKNVVVKREAAIEISMKDYVSLLKKRKLSLLVDLDATILHSTDRNIPRNMKDVYHYKMRAEGNNHISLDYHTKFRPFLKDFLTNMNLLYEMHIYTFGNKSYAEKIAEIIDPDKRFFGHRIISKDDSFDPMKKSANLKSLFPIGDNMVCIIDDRTDVWNNAPNCIHVQPYMFFPEIGDINDPYKLKELVKFDSNHINKQSKVPEQVISNEKTVTPAGDKEENPNGNVSEVAKTDETNTELGDIVSEIQENSPQEKLDAIDIAIKSDEVPALQENMETKHSDNVENEDKHSQIDDPDRYLVSLAKILEEIHRRFYNEIDELLVSESVTEIIENGHLPDVKQLMTKMRSEVLQGCQVNFSGLIPLNQKVKDTYEYRMLTSLGAEYLHNVSLPSLKSRTDISTDPAGFTTHLICKSEGTKKMKQVAHYITEINRMITDKSQHLPKSIHKVHLVKHDWLWQSYFFWQKVDENDFTFIPTLKQLPIPDGFSEMKFVQQAKKPSSPVNLRKRSLTPPDDFSSKPKQARLDSIETNQPCVISDEDLKDLIGLDSDSLSGISTDSYVESDDSFNDKSDVPLDNPILHYSLQEQMDMFNEVDEAMDEEKCEKLSSPLSSDYYKSDSSSLSDNSDNESGDFQKPPKHWEQTEAAVSNESNSSDEKEMDYGDTDSNNDLEQSKDDCKSDFDDLFDDCNY